MSKLSDVFTYVSDSGVTASWIDHIVSSNGIDSRVSDVAVLYGYMGSDHRPLSATVNDVLFNEVIANDSDGIAVDCTAPDWSKVDGRVANEFSAALDQMLLNVAFPRELTIVVALVEQLGVQTVPTSVLLINTIMM